MAYRVIAIIMILLSIALSINQYGDYRYKKGKEAAIEEYRAASMETENRILKMEQRLHESFAETKKELSDKLEQENINLRENLKKDYYSRACIQDDVRNSLNKKAR